MRLLVTRPEPDALRQADLLRAHGHEPVIAPLLHVEPLHNPIIPLEHVAALIVTSRNAVRTLKQHPLLAEALRLPVYAVGRATAEAARQLGFAQIIEGPGTGEGLAALILDRGAPGPFLHLSGKDIAFDMTAALERCGLQASRIAIYRAEPAAALPAPVFNLLRIGGLDGVILMSPRTAATFAALLPQDLVPILRDLRAFCLSEAVAQALQPLPFALRIAVKPREEEILALIDAEAAS
jgi:uroporphyrinogen-III synthase